MEVRDVVCTPADSFVTKAPLLADGELAAVLLEDVLDPTVVERVAAVYCYGSLADPDASLDADGSVSDVDVYVVLEDGALADLGAPERASEVSTRFSATQHGVLCRLAAQGVLDVHARPEPFDVPLNVAGGPLARSVRQAERAVFHAREGDVELLQFRPMDCTIGTEAAFREFVEPDPHLKVWPCDR